MNKSGMTFKKLLMQTLPLVVIFMLFQHFWLNVNQEIGKTILGGTVFFTIYFTFMCWVHGLIFNKKN